MPVTNNQEGADLTMLKPKDLESYFSEMNGLILSKVEVARTGKRRSYSLIKRFQHILSLVLSLFPKNFFFKVWLAAASPSFRLFPISHVDV